MTDAQQPEAKPLELTVTDHTGLTDDVRLDITRKVAALNSEERAALLDLAKRWQRASVALDARATLTIGGQLASEGHLVGDAHLGVFASAGGSGHVTVHVPTVQPDGEIGTAEVTVPVRAANVFAALMPQNATEAQGYLKLLLMYIIFVTSLVKGTPTNDALATAEDLLKQAASHPAPAAPSQTSPRPPATGTPSAPVTPTQTTMPPQP